MRFTKKHMTTCNFQKENNKICEFLLWGLEIEI